MPDAVKAWARGFRWKRREGSWRRVMIVEGGRAGGRWL